MTWRKARFGFSDKILAMIVLLRHLLGWMVSAFRSREDLVLEMRWQRNLESTSEDQTLFLVTRPRHGSRFQGASSPVAESAGNQKNRRARNPFNVGRNDLANHRVQRVSSHASPPARSFTAGRVSQSGHFTCYRQVVPFFCFPFFLTFVSISDICASIHSIFGC